MVKYIYILIVAMATSISVQGQQIAIKTNVLYAATTYTPNLGIEIGLGQRTTLDLSGGYNPWNLKGSVTDNKKFVHWVVEPEFRYWPCERFNGHFFGVHALGGQYNISGHKLFGLLSKKARYEGYMVGGGFTYGYQFVLGRRWNLEASLGVGYARLNYTQYACAKCGRIVARDKTHNYFGPTKIAISILFFIK
ncbi:MAG: DUF3575 domain-containing protein [Alistipes sp.]